MKLIRWCTTSVIAIFAMMACLAQGAMTTGASLPKPSASDVIQMVGPDAKIDWTIFQFRATGIGIAPEGMTGSKAKAMAREAAQVIAERNLLKAVQGVHITSETTVENLVLTSDVIKTNLDGVLNGAMVVQEKDLNDGSYLVVMAIPMLGEQGVAKAIDLPKQVASMPKNEVTLADLPAPKGLQGDFTGLLIDCRGLKMSAAMSPTIYSPDKEALYPRAEISTDIVNDKGVVAYYKSVEAAKAIGRVGDHPLIIKASGYQKENEGMWHTSPTVTQADAARILGEDARTGFLKQLAVGFIID